MTAEHGSSIYHAVVAVEWLEADTAKAAGHTVDPEADTRRRQLMEQKCLVFGATLDRHAGRFGFIRISHAPDTVTAAETAVQLGFALLRSVAQAAGSAAHPLGALRLGLALEASDQPDPLSGIPQRMAASPNTMVATRHLAGCLSTPYVQVPMEDGMQLSENHTSGLASADTQPTEDGAFYPADYPADDTDDEAAVQNEPSPAPSESYADATLQHLPETSHETSHETSQPLERSSHDDVSRDASRHASAPSHGETGGGVRNLAELEQIAIPQYWMINENAANTPGLTGSVETARQKLYALMDRFLSQPEKGQLIVLTGHEGCGKTRLIETLIQQFAQQAAEQQKPTPCFWLSGQSGPPFTPLGLWQSVFSRFYQVAPLGVPVTALKEVVESQSFDQPEFNALWQSLMGHWLGWQPLQPLDASFSIQPQALAHTLYQFFYLVAQHYPVVMLLDDLEEADPASLDVLIELLGLGLCQQLPVLLMVTHNLEASPTQALAHALNAGQRYVLPLYQPDELTAYLQNGPLQAVWGQFPPQLLEQVTHLCHGNALIVEESLRLLFLKGALNPLVGPELSLQFEEVSQVFLEKLALLPPEAQQLAQWLSVIGHPIRPDVLTQLVPSEVDMTEPLKLLQEHGIVITDATQGVVFRHRLLQQWIYHSMPDEQRHEWHGYLAQVFDSLSDQGLHVSYAILAEQAELAGNGVLAAHAWSGAGVLAANLQSLTGFNLSMVRAAQLFDSIQPEHPDTRNDYQLVLQYLAQCNVQQHPQLTASMLPEHPPEHAPEAEKLQQWLLRCTSCEPLGQFAEGLQVVKDTLLSLQQQPDTDGECLYLQAQTAKWQGYLGLMAVADDQLRQHVMPALNDPGQMRHPLHPLTWLDAYSTKLRLQLLHCRAELFDTLDLMLSHPYLQQPPVSWQLLLARVLRHQGHFAKAQEALNAIDPVDPLDTQAWHVEQTSLYLDLGQWPRALGTVQVAFGKPVTSAWHQVQLRWGQGCALVNMGSADKVGEGMRLLKQALALAMDNQYRLEVAQIKLALCQGLLKAQQYPLVQQQLTQLLEQAELPPLHRYQALPLLSRALRRQGQVLEAGKLLEPYWKTVTDSRQLPLVAAMAQEVGLFYADWSKQSETPSAHVQTAIQFLQRARRLWEQMQHAENVALLDKYLKG